jgi:hypothetical protein
MRPTRQLHDLGQSLWLDNITRETLRAIPVNARRGACASFGGALRRPFGIVPVIPRPLE